MQRIPDNAIVGWRGWRIVDGQLESPLHGAGTRWPGRVALAASCTSTTHDLDVTPHPRCFCGLYAFKRRGRVEFGYDVVGQVALWGRVYEHEDGYRGEFGYPIAFVERSGGGAAVQQLAARYGAAILPGGQLDGQRGSHHNSLSPLEPALFFAMIILTITFFVVSKITP